MEYCQIFPFAERETTFNFSKDNTSSMTPQIWSTQFLAMFLMEFNKQKLKIFVMRVALCFVLRFFGKNISLIFFQRSSGQQFTKICQKISKIIFQKSNIVNDT